MGQQIIKQPNGKYAVFSSIVDDFIFYDATPKDIINKWARESRKEITKKVNDIIDQIENNKKPYCQFTMTFKEACQTAINVHGREASQLAKRGVKAGGASA